MDSDISEDRSPPPSDNTGPSWTHWDREDSSVSGLSLEATHELHSLVEDKEIAAKAVAFVVNSTRKGIVPLCADVATLMRAKVRLERRVSRLRTENSLLHSSISGSLRTSNSNSPTLGSFSSHDNQDKLSPSCSRSSSQCSSVQSTSSPKAPRSPKPPRSPHLHRTSAFSIPNGRHGDSLAATATVHQSERGMILAQPSGGRQKRHRRKNSLPEMTAKPHVNVPKVSPRVTTDPATSPQCAVTSDLAVLPPGEPPCGTVAPSQPVTAQGDVKRDGCTSQRDGCAPQRDGCDSLYSESLQIHSRLAEELGAAKKEIEVLRGRLRELEMKQLAVKFSSDRFHVENEYTTTSSLPPTSTVFTPPSVTSGNQCQALTTTELPQQPSTCQTCQCPTNSSTAVANKPPIRVEPPLSGCKCQECCDKGAVAMETPQQRGISLAVGDHVVLSGEKTGHVLYVGHLEGTGDARAVFVGIQLDAPVGCHDGILDGRRYFSCERNCGIFVPLQEVVCVINNKDESKKPGTNQQPPCAEEPGNQKPANKKSSSSSNHGSRHRGKGHGKEKRYLPRTSANLRLPKDSVLSNGHLV